MKLIDLNYHPNNECTRPEEILKKHETSLGYLHFIKQKLKAQVVKHINYEGTRVADGIEYVFFKRRNNFFQIPFRTNSWIKKQQPNLVLVQGTIFPLQVIALRMQLGKKVVIALQHHGETPFKGIKKSLQQLASRFVNAYFFTALDNAAEWRNQNIIREKQKCFQLLEASTYLRPRPKKEAKERTGMNGNLNFLWVGRLNANKDPLTVLRGFERYLTIHNHARLYMIYQESDLLAMVESIINKSDLMKQSVELKGMMDHNSLTDYYSAADYYLSGSHKEGSGYALIESMACGCIPVVTNIPTFRKITADGNLGFLYQPGDANDLFRVLQNINPAENENKSHLVLNHFENELSFKSISIQLYSHCETLINK